MSFDLKKIYVFLSLFCVVKIHAQEDTALNRRLGLKTATLWQTAYLGDSTIEGPQQIMTTYYNSKGQEDSITYWGPKGFTITSVYQYDTQGNMIAYCDYNKQGNQDGSMNKIFYNHNLWMGYVEISQAGDTVAKGIATYDLHGKLQQTNHYSTKTGDRYSFIIKQYDSLSNIIIEEKRNKENEWVYFRKKTYDPNGNCTKDSVVDNLFTTVTKTTYSYLNQKWLKTHEILRKRDQSAKFKFTYRFYPGGAYVQTRKGPDGKVLNHFNEKSLLERSESLIGRDKSVTMYDNGKEISSLRISPSGDTTYRYELVFGPNGLLMQEKTFTGVYSKKRKSRYSQTEVMEYRYTFSTAENKE